MPTLIEIGQVWQEKLTKKLVRVMEYEFTIATDEFIIRWRNDGGVRLYSSLIDKFRSDYQLTDESIEPGQFDAVSDAIWAARQPIYDAIRRKGADQVENDHRHILATIAWNQAFSTLRLICNAYPQKEGVARAIVA